MVFRRRVRSPARYSAHSAGEESPRVIQQGPESYLAGLRRGWERSRLITSAVLLVLLAPSVVVLHEAWSTNRVLYGLNVPNNDRATITSLTGKTGYRPQLINVFVKLDTDATHFSPSTLARISEIGAKPMVTLEPWSWRSQWGRSRLPQYSLATLARGTWDRQLRNVARTIRSHRGIVYLRFAHEMNGWWYPWAEKVNGNRPGDFVRAWRHVHSLFRSSSSTNVRWVWSPNALTYSSKGTSNLASLYPGDRYADVISMTAYGHGASAGETFDATLRALKTISSKPIFLSETGADGPRKLEWITSFGQYLRSHREIVAFVWYNTPASTVGGSDDYRFDDTPANVEAFRNSLRAANVTSRVPAIELLG